MGYDSITNASIPAFPKDCGKKKRTNRLAKLKQCKLDARREQWLSQVKNKGCKEESNGGGGSPPSSLHQNDGRNRSLDNSEMRPRGEENDGSSLHDSDLEFLENSPTSSVMGVKDSKKERPGSSSSSTRSSSGCCSGSVTEEEGDDECLDDWEAVADALTADEKGHNLGSDPPVEPEIIIRTVPPPEIPNGASKTDALKPESKGAVPRAQGNGRAWRPDDAFRPQSLPNLSKQYSFPMNSDRQCGRGAVTWACDNVISQPSSCPICYEDLDLTDSSFLPCLCGFRLCLFCHKRILEADGRCPGCRKQYDTKNGEMCAGGGVSIRLARSCSMGMRF